MLRLFKQINKQFQKVMKNTKIKNENPEIEVHFIQHKKIKDQEELENKLQVQLLRLAISNKLTQIASIFHIPQNQVQQHFLNYELLSQAPFPIQTLFESSNLKLIRNKGKVYFGEISNRQMSGKGICYYSEGKIYEGYFKDNKRQAYGCQIYSSGNIYIGQYTNNKKNGKGHFFWFNIVNEEEPKFVQYYDGQWWGGLPDGRGIHQKANGDYYEGTFKNGLKHGFGEENFQNGDYYKGQYVNGLPEGIGQYHWKDGSYYSGDFKQGLRSGYGKWKMNVKQKNFDQYEGHYVMDKKQGYGQYVWANGWSYRGNFENDHREGYGELMNQQNICIFKGQWRKGEKIPIEEPNNTIKISRPEFGKQISTKQKEVKIDGIYKDINQNSFKITISNEHELLPRPGFLIRRSKQPNHQRYQSLNKKQTVGNQIQSLSTLTSRVGTEIQRPLSKIGLSSSRNLKSSRVGF